jgi:3-dehydroquinate synthase
MSEGRAENAQGKPREHREIAGDFDVRFSHRVLFSDGVFDEENPTLARLMVGSGSAAARPGVVVVVDSGVGHLAGRVEGYAAGHARLLGRSLVVPGGEVSKRGRGVFEAVVERLNEAALDRHGYCVIVGGGAVLDAAGFAAGVVHRGVRVIRVPTTVLAQNDAGVGVKNGIDAFGKKNFLGAFAPAWAVVNDFTLLEGLPANHWRDGTAEAVKVGLIRDAGFLGWIEGAVEELGRREAEAFRHLIFRCAELHVRHIATGGDPFERGSARPLDFGHWAAHKLEQMSGFSLSHGSAVATGMAIDSLYSARVGLASGETAERTLRLLRGLGFEVSARGVVGDAEELLAGLEEFREHLGGQLTITLLRGVGEAVEVNEIDRKLMQRCIEDVRAGAA